MKNLCWLTVIVWMGVSFTSCKATPDKREIDAARGVTGLPQDDPTFLRLMDTAQKYLPDFIASFKENGSNPNYRFVIKSDFSEGDIHEHMWSLPFRFDNNTFTCVFADSAYDIGNVKKGDTIFVKANAVEDWALYNFLTGEEKGLFSDKYLSGE